MDRSHIIEQPFWTLIVRGAQGLLGLVILALAAAELSVSSPYASDFNGRFGWTLFVGLATMAIAAYYIVTYMFLPKLYNKWAVAALDIVGIIFWLIVWALMADYTAMLNGSYYSRYYRLKAKRMTSDDVVNIVYTCLAFSLITWFLFIATFAFFVLALLRQRREAAGTTAPGVTAPGVTADKPVEAAELQAAPPAAHYPTPAAAPYPAPSVSPAPQQYPQPTISPVGYPQPTGSPVPYPQPAGSPVPYPQPTGSPVPYPQPTGSPVPYPQATGSPAPQPYPPQDVPQPYPQQAAPAPYPQQAAPAAPAPYPSA